MKNRGLLFTILTAAAASAIVAVAMLARAAPKDGIEPYTFETAAGEKIKAELGRFSVPENRGKEGSRSIRLAFVRFRSTSPRPGPPIVYLAGGPGGSGIDAARGARFPLFMALRAIGDVIAFDQRGTGMSGFEDLDCDDRYLIPFDHPADRREAGRIIGRVTRGCVDRLRASGIDLSAYNTVEGAADLEDLRRFVGAEKISLWGISYGTHLALAAMRSHGGGIARVILAGLEGPDGTYKLPGDQQALLETIAAIAGADPEISGPLPDLLGSIRKLIARLGADPQAVRLAHPETGEVTDVRVGAFDLQYVLAGMLSGPDTFAAMPDLIARLERGDWTALALASAMGRTGEGLHGMPLAMDCASGASAARMERIAREAGTTLLGDAINAPFPEVCEGQGIDDLGDGFRAPVTSDIPALLISGTLDGRTPVRNGVEAMAGLTRAHHLILEGAGHSDPLFLSSPKILEAMLAFLRGEKVPFDRVRLPPVEFIPPRRVASVDDGILARYAGTYRIAGGKDVRRVIKAGSLLWTQREGSIPLPIRPISETEFFYEGMRTRLTFRTDGKGKVTGMVMYAEGDGEGVPAKKID
jgi:pimeloyl-ACP methyl ester carboxylesterase